MKIITGGQTGVDRAALDAAIEAGIEIGGWCPRRRLAEDGPIAPRYPLVETPLEETDQRTRWNVRDSDGTLIICPEVLAGGTALTIDSAKQLGKPHRIIRPAVPQLRPTHEWIENQKLWTLNVAGPRESEQPGTYALTLAFMRDLLTMMCQRT